MQPEQGPGEDAAGVGRRGQRKHRMGGHQGQVTFPEQWHRVAGKMPTGV